MSELNRIRHNMAHLKHDIVRAASKMSKTALLWVLYIITAFWVGSFVSGVLWKIMYFNNLKVSAPVDFSTKQNREDKTKTDVIAHMDDGTTKTFTIPAKDWNEMELLEKAEKEFYDDRTTVSPEAK